LYFHDNIFLLIPSRILDLNSILFHQNKPKIFKIWCKICENDYISQNWSTWL